MHSTTSIPFRKMIIGVASLLFMFTMLTSSLTQAQTAKRDCDDNAVLRCGAYTTAELKQKYDSQAGVKTIFTNFGISSTDVGQMHSTAVSGFVTRGGRVLIGDKTVAIDAQTAGRQNMPGSQSVTQNGVTFYTRPPSVSFAQDKLDAYVVMKDGQFQFAVLKSCGNPVKATSVEKPKPAPQPVPVQPLTPPPAAPVQPTPVVPAPVPAPEKSKPVQVQQVVETKQVVEVTTPAPAPAPAPVAAALPKTGPVDVMGASAAVGMASTFGYGFYEWLRRRYGLI